MGIKPLYFFSNGEFIYFGSEIRPLKFFNKLTPDKKNLSEIIFLGIQAVNQLVIKMFIKYYQGSIIMLTLTIFM